MREYQHDLFIARARKFIDREIERRGMSELRCIPKSTMHAIKLPYRRLQNSRDRFGIDRAGASAERLLMRDRLHHALGGIQHVLVLLGIGLRDAAQHMFETGPSEAIIGREVGAAEERMAIRSQEGGQ